MTALPLFPTSVVGSLPRPDAVRALLGQASSSDQLDAAIREAVALQENAGIDILTDGEWRRASYIGVIADWPTASNWAPILLTAALGQS